MTTDAFATPPLQMAFAAGGAWEQAQCQRSGRSRSRSKHLDEHVAALRKGFASFVETSAAKESRSSRHRKSGKQRQHVGRIVGVTSSDSDISQSSFVECKPVTLREENVFYIDVRGRQDVLDSRGLIRPGVFYKERAAAMRDGSVLGLLSKSKKSRRSARARISATLLLSSPHCSPPRRRYFGKKATAQRDEKNEVTYIDHSSWMELEPTHGQVLNTHQSNFHSDQNDNSKSFIPLATIPSQIRNNNDREAKQEALHLRCRKTPDDPEVWLRFAEFQWSSLQEELGASSRQVREKQRSIVEAGLEACPGNVKLLCAAACAEGDECADLDAEKVHASRRARLLACGHAEAAEELVWTYIAGSARAYGEEVSPIDAIRKAALDSLSVLAARKIVAGHDGRVCMALERAELAAISAVAFADAATGNSSRALALLRAEATLCTFFPGREPEALREVWTNGCLLGDPGALYLVQSLRLVEAAWEGARTATSELPAELASLADLLEKNCMKDQTTTHEHDDDTLGGLASLLKVEGGRMRCWVAKEFLRTARHAEEHVPYEEIAPFLVSFRGDVTRREALLRYLDAMGSPALARHLPGTPYRRAFLNVFIVLELRLPSRQKTSCDTEGICGGLPACTDRPGILARSALQGLLTWPKDPLLLESLLAALWNLRKQDVKLPRRVLKASEDPRLYFDYAQGLWARSHYDAARAVFLKLCHTAVGGVDARVAMGWWHLEMLRTYDPAHTVEHRHSSGMPPRAFRVLCALAKGRFETTVLSDDPLGADVGLHRLQAVSRLEQVLANQSQIDSGGFRFFVSSHHAVLVALCALLAQSSPQRALDVILKHLPASDGNDYSGQTILSGKAKSSAEEHRCRALAMGFFIEALLASPATKPQFLREVVWIGLHRDSQSPWLLRILVSLHLRSGTVAAMRRDLDRALRLHRPPSLLAAECCTAAGLRVALEAEMCIPTPSPERLTALCERACEAGAGLSFFSGPVLWSLYHMAFCLKARLETISTGTSLCRKDFELRRRVAVRALQRHPYAKSLWLLQLAAWEARSMNLGSSTEDEEEEVLDLIEAMEASKIRLVGDPLEAVA